MGNLWFSDDFRGNRNQLTRSNSVNVGGPVVYLLSILHNFIQQSLNLDSEQVEILLAACRRFAMMRISDNGPTGNKA